MLPTRALAVVALATLLLPATAMAAPGSPPATARPPAAGGTSHRDGSHDDDEVGVAARDPEDAEVRVAVRGPSIGAVLAAAYTTAGLDGDPGRSWIRRARLAGLVPWVTVRGARNVDWQDPQSEVGRSTVFEVRATWRLDRLLFEARELQVAGLEASRRRERRRLATSVIRLYFTWRRAAASADPDNDRDSPRLAETTAELDALTDGWFSEELARLQDEAAQRGMARAGGRPAARPRAR